MKKPLILPFLFSLAACTTVPPKNSDNICATFRENEEWYANAKQSFEKWGVPIPVQMAIMHQESHFIADAQPPRTWLLDIIPLEAAGITPHETDLADMIVQLGEDTPSHIVVPALHRNRVEIRQIFLKKMKLAELGFQPQDLTEAPVAISGKNFCA